MEAVTKVTEIGGYLYNIIGSIIIIIVSIILLYFAHYFAYEDPVDPKKRNNKITITYIVFGLFMGFVILFISGVLHLILINSNVGYMVNTATGISGIKNMSGITNIMGIHQLF
jgi:hypothetical protein